MRIKQCGISGLVCGCLSVWLAVGVVRADSAFTWNKEKNEVTADVRGLGVTNLLERVAHETGWEIFLEPGISHKSSAKFKNFSSGEALRMLLGDVNFALIPQTNAASRLYVFRTAINNATHQISNVKKKGTASGPKRVPNELIVRLKPGQSIEEIAKALGATVVGSIPEINAYRLRFDDAADATDALVDLASNPGVAGVDFNYYLDKPEPVQGVVSSTGLPSQLRLSPAGDSSGLVVGLVDTAVQALDGDLDKFVIKRLSVAGEAAVDSGVPTHGTTMAESILRGMEAAGNDSSAAKFVCVDVFGNNGTTTTFDLASGIVLAVNNGANWVNVSVGGSGSSTVLQNIVQTVTDRGIPIFAAAGNEPTGEPVYPAAYSDVVAVTALSRGQVASYANNADFVDVAAPGSAVVYFQGRPYYVQGTSVSTAHTTGLAIGIAQKTGQTWGQIQPELLKSLAVPTATK